MVEWAYDRPHRQLVVPYPNVHVTCRDGAAEVHGVSGGHLFEDLDGTGRVFGVAFRPGVFRPFPNAPVQSVTDRSVPVSSVFAGLPERADVEAAEDWLRRNLPEPDPGARTATEVVELIVDDPRTTGVDGPTWATPTNPPLRPRLHRHGRRDTHPVRRALPAVRRDLSTTTSNRPPPTPHGSRKFPQRRSFTHRDDLPGGPPPGVLRSTASRCRPR